MKRSTKLQLLKDKLNADYERELAKAFNKQKGRTIINHLTQVQKRLEE